MPCSVYRSRVNPVGDSGLMRTYSRILFRGAHIMKQRYVQGESIGPAYRKVLNIYFVIGGSLSLTPE